MAITYTSGVRSNPTFNQLVKDFQVPNPIGADTLGGLFPFQYDSATINKIFQDAITAGADVNKELYDIANNKYYGQVADSYDTLLRQMQLLNANDTVNNASSGVAAANQLSLLLGASQQGADASQTIIDEQYALAQQEAADRVAAEKEALQYQNDLAAMLGSLSASYADPYAQAYAAELSYWAMMQQLGLAGDGTGATGGYGTGGYTYPSYSGSGVNAGDGTEIMVGPNVFDAMRTNNIMDLSEFKEKHPELYTMQSIADAALNKNTLPTADPAYQKAYNSASKDEKAFISNYYTTREPNLLAIKQGYTPDPNSFGYTIQAGNPNNVSALPVGYFSDSIFFNPEASQYGQTMVANLDNELNTSGLNKESDRTPNVITQWAANTNWANQVPLLNLLVPDENVTNLSADALSNYSQFYTPEYTPVAPKAQGSSAKDFNYSTYANQLLANRSTTPAKATTPSTSSVANALKNSYSTAAPVAGNSLANTRDALLKTGLLTNNNLLQAISPLAAAGLPTLNTDDDEDDNTYKYSIPSNAVNQAQRAQALQALQAASPAKSLTNSALKTTQANANTASMLKAQQEAAAAAAKAQQQAIIKAAQEAAAKKAASAASSWKPPTINPSTWRPTISSPGPLGNNTIANNVNSNFLKNTTSKGSSSGANKYTTSSLF